MAFEIELPEDLLRANKDTEKGNLDWFRVYSLIREGDLPEGAKVSTSCDVMEIEPFIFEVNNYGQDLIADSSGIAELYALNSGAKDGLGVKVILTEMGFKIDLKLLTDSSAARAMCMRVGHSAKTKHLEIKTLFLQQLVKQKRLTVGKIDTHRNKADVGTKHFDVQRLNYLKEDLVEQRTCPSSLMMMVRIF